MGLIIIAVLALIAAVLLTAVEALAALWALNHLFAMGFAYDFWNWAAALVLIAILRQPSTGSNECTK